MKRSFFFLAIAILLSLIACKGKKEQAELNADGSYYTCPMHPSVQSAGPGSCPVCNMSLIRVTKQVGGHNQHEGNYITINKRQQQLAGIKTDTVKLRVIEPASTILGTVAVDEEQVKMVSSRVKGRIEKLHIRTTGGYVAKGAPVYDIYSEQLFADESEYLALLQRSKSAGAHHQSLRDMILAAERKLLLWGLTEKQVEELRKANKVPDQTTFFAHTDGYITEVFVKEGDYVEPGTPLMSVTSLSSVWIEAQVYSNEIEKMGNSSSYIIYPDVDQSETLNARLVFSNPVVDSDSKVQRLRLRADNRSGALMPGMMVYVSPARRTRPVPAVPKTAVLPEKMKTVWVLAHDDTFEQRMVETGAESREWVEILSGLKEGDVVVTGGAYLISSEFILKSGAGQTHEH